MNYIKELNAFYDCVEREPLSASAVSLWNTLLHINNKTAWTDEFTVAGTVLKLKGGLADSSFKRARKELEERGFIEFRSRGTRMAPIYKMKRLYLEFSYVNDGKMGQGDRLVEEQVVQTVDNCVNLAYQNVPYKDGQEQLKDNVNNNVNHIMDDSVNRMRNLQADHNMNLMTAPLNKVNKTKQNETKLSPTSRGKAIEKNETNETEEKHKTDAIVFYQENFGIVSPYLAEDILSWINDLGDELVTEGMRRALERGKVNFGYVKGILKSWVKQGISSVEMLRVREMEKEHSIRNNLNRSRSRTRYDVVVPDWFWERKEHNQEQQAVVAEDEDEEVDVGELLREYLAQRVV